MGRDNWRPKDRPPPPPPHRKKDNDSHNNGGSNVEGRGGDGGSYRSRPPKRRNSDRGPPPSPPHQSVGGDDDARRDGGSSSNNNKRNRSPSSPGGSNYGRSRKRPFGDRAGGDRGGGGKRRGGGEHYNGKKRGGSGGGDYYRGSASSNKKDNDNKDTRDDDNNRRSRGGGGKNNRDDSRRPPLDGQDRKNNNNKNNNRNRRRRGGGNKRDGNKHSEAYAPLPPPPPPIKEIEPAVSPVTTSDANEKPQTQSLVKYRHGSIWSRELQVGEGTYGKVYKARNSETGKMAALKRLRLESERDGVPITAIREVKLLQALRHPGIVSLREMMVETGSIYMAFEYMDHDLAGILAHPDLTLTNGQKKYLFKQMLSGLAYLHHRGVLHRDIKGSNILIDNNGVVKIADFGLARTVDLSNPFAHYTNRVITLWYRPPEILLGATVYSDGVDVWGLGCLLVELFTKRAIFQTQDEIAQLNAVFDIMGTPTCETWPELESMPWYRLMMPSKDTPAKSNRFSELYSETLPTFNCLDLAGKMLSVNPKARISAQGALDHEYFVEDPAPESLDLSEIGEWHDFEAKRRRRRAQKQQQQHYHPQTSAPPSK